MAGKAAMNMPPDVEARIRAIPGNQTCADCSNIKPQWASVSYGTLVCLECSGQHRSLGVHLSFVRSVQMDSWTERQIAAMETSGGNAAFNEYMSSRGIAKNMQIATKYNTKQAAYYRERLTRKLDGKTEPPPDPGRYDPATGGSEAQGAEPLPGETTDEYNARQARQREAARERLRQKFGDGGIGGVGCDPGPANEGLDLGGAVGGAARLLGGAVGGAVGFLRTSVIENEGLHSTLRGTVGTVSSGASGAWNTIRRSTTSEDGALAKGLGWTAGAVGGLVQRAGTGLSDFVNDGDQKSPEKPVSGGRADAPKRGGMDFDDEWNSWGDEEPAKPAAPEPTKEDMNRLKRDLGMKLSSADAPAAKAQAPAAAPPAASPAPAPAAAPAAARSPEHGGSSPEKPKKKTSLLEEDDFFSEFGL